jgi:hypothetical protein
VRLIALVALLAACGGSSAGGSDGGAGDDGPRDPDTGPATRGTVTVHLVDRNDAPLAGLHVVFDDTDATVTDVTTDSAGVAAADVFAGASLTALRARDTGDAYSLTTVLAVQPGDDITLVGAPPTSLGADDPFTARTIALPSIDLAGGTKSGSTTVFTTATPHGLAPGDTVIVADVLPAGYNGTWAVAATPTATTFTVGYANTTPGVGGTVAKAQPFTVSFPSYTGATSYEVDTPCGPTNVGSSTTATVYLRAGCSQSTMDVVVYAKSSATAELAWIGETNVAFSPGGNTTLTGSWTDVATLTATYSNPTASVSHVTVARHTPYLRGAPQEFQKQPAGTAFTLTTGFPAAAWMRSTFTCEGACNPSATGVPQQTLAEAVDGTATTYTDDIGANLLPWISASYDPGTTTMDVTVTGTGSYDLFEANLKYFRNAPTGQVIFTWRVFGPTAGDVTFPALPSSLPGDPTVRTTDTESAYQVYLCETDAVADYRAAIGNPYVTLAACESTPVATTRPAGGTRNRLSSWN